MDTRQQLLSAGEGIDRAVSGAAQERGREWRGWPPVPGHPKDHPLGVALETGSADSINPQPGQDIQDIQDIQASVRGGKNERARQREFLVVWDEIGRSTRVDVGGQKPILDLPPRLLAALGVDFALRILRSTTNRTAARTRVS